MDLFSILGIALRRWYVTLPIAAIGFALAFQAYQSVQTVYSGSTTIVVLPGEQNPDSDEEDTVSNPYAGSGGARFAANVLSRNINSAAFADRIDPAVASDTTFLSDVASQQPLITVEATAPGPEEVAAVLQQITDNAAVVLDEFQADAGAPQPTRFRSATAVDIGDVTDATPSRFRTSGAMAAVALVAAVAAAVVVEALVNRRRVTRQQQESTSRAARTQARRERSRSGRTVSVQEFDDQLQSTPTRRVSSDQNPDHHDQAGAVAETSPAAAEAPVATQPAGPRADRRSTRGTGQRGGRRPPRPEKGDTEAPPTGDAAGVRSRSQPDVTSNGDTSPATEDRAASVGHGRRDGVGADLNGRG